MRKQKGQIVTVLTLIALGVMSVGALVGSKVVQKQTPPLESEAVSTGADLYAGEIKLHKEPTPGEYLSFAFEIGNNGPEDIFSNTKIDYKVDYYQKLSGTNDFTLFDTVERDFRGTIRAGQTASNLYGGRIDELDSAPAVYKIVFEVKAPSSPVDPGIYNNIRTTEFTVGEPIPTWYSPTLEPTPTSSPRPTSTATITLEPIPTTCSIPPEIPTSDPPQSTCEWLRENLTYICSWNPVEGATGYTYYVARPGAEIAENTTIETSVTLIAKDGIEPGVEYNCQVVPFNQCGSPGAGPWGNLATCPSIVPTPLLSLTPTSSIPSPSPSPFTPTPTVTPNPTPETSCSFKWKAFVKEYGTNRIIKNDLNLSTVGNIPGTGRFNNGQISFSIDNLSQIINNAYIQITSSTSPITSSAIGNWEIMNTTCQAMGTGSCPQDNLGSTERISPVNVDCGAEYEFNWYLKWKESTTPTPTPSSEPFYCSDQCFGPFNTMQECVNNCQVPDLCSGPKPYCCCPQDYPTPTFKPTSTPIPTATPTLAPDSECPSNLECISRYSESGACEALCKAPFVCTGLFNRCCCLPLPTTTPTPPTCPDQCSGGPFNTANDCANYCQPPHLCTGPLNCCCPPNLPTATPVPTSVPIPTIASSDITALTVDNAGNNDGFVNNLDCQAIIDNYGNPGTGDVDRNGVVNGTDYSYCLQFIGQEVK